MRTATRIVASLVGITAGLLGMEHGYFETLQGHVSPGSILISAFGPPCQAKLMWHSCEPAMTVIPDFFVTGILAMVVSFIVLVWAAAFVQRTHGGVILIVLSIVQLLVGGGFVSPLVGIIAGVAGTRINAPLVRWRPGFSTNSGRFLAKLWPWSLIICLLWLAAEWFLGALFNGVMVNLGCVLLFFSIGLLTLAVITGIAHDQRTASDLSTLPSTGR